MNTFNTEQFLAAQKAGVESFFGFTQKAFEGVEKIVELNLQATKASLGEAAENTKAMLSVKDAQEFMGLQAAMMQPSAEKAVAYTRHLYDIVSSANAEVTKAAEANFAEGQKRVMSIVDTAIKNAPAGSDSAVALVKSAVAAANNAIETVQKAAKQATEVAEANFTQMTNTAVKATQSTISKARKAA